LSGPNGASNGASNGSTIKTITVAQLEARVARYRTALVVLLEMVKRDAGYMNWSDQNLLREIGRILDEESDHDVEARAD